MPKDDDPRTGKAGSDGDENGFAGGTNATSRVPRDNLVVTHHETTIGGKKVSYTATAGTVVLNHEKVAEGEKEGTFEGVKPRAEVFFVAYELDGVTDKSGVPLPDGSSRGQEAGRLIDRTLAELDDRGVLFSVPLASLLRRLEDVFQARYRELGEHAAAAADANLRFGAQLALAVPGFSACSARMASVVWRLARASRNLPSRISVMIAADASKYSGPGPWCAAPCSRWNTLRP